MEAPARVQTICRSCWAGCGVLVEVEGERVTGVRGDPEHPQSRGYLCPKGAAIPWAHHRPDRLHEPRMRGTSSGWEALLGDLARTIERAVAAHGPDAVGTYTGSGSGILDTLGTRALRRFMAALGSTQIYSPNTVDVAPALRAAELVTGYAYDLIPRWWPEDDQSKLVIFVGSNPLVSHGYFTVLPDAARRLRAFQRRGGRIWVLDPSRTRTAEAADGHVAPIPGTDPVVLAWLVRQALGRLDAAAPAVASTRAQDRALLARALQPFDVDTVASLSGVARPELERLWAAIREAGRIAVVSGTGLTFGPHGVLGEWLHWALLILTDSLDQPGGMWIDPGWLVPLDRRTAWTPAPENPVLGSGPASRPELSRIAGEVPCAAMADEIEHGPLRVLLVAGGSPLTAIPDPGRLTRAFGRLDALAVHEVAETPLASLATHLMPAAGQLERLDLSGFWFSRAQLARPAVPLAAEHRPLWWVMAKLAARLGLLDKVLDGHDPDRVSEEALLHLAVAGARDSAEDLFAAGPHGLTNPRLQDWARRTAVPGGKWRLAPHVLVERLPMLLRPRDPGRPLLLVCRRQERRVNSANYPATFRAKDSPALFVSPQDAQALAISEGGAVRVSSDHGFLEARASLSPDMSTGVVALPHGWSSVNVTQLTTAVAVDPLTSQPQMTAIPVSVEPLTTS